MMATTRPREREETWDKLQERLQRRRKDQLSRTGTASSNNSYRKTPPRGRNGYHRTPPPRHLPSLDSPPGYMTAPVDSPVSGPYPSLGPLRRTSYEVVPPLMPHIDAYERDPFSDADSYDPRVAKGYREPYRSQDDKKHHSNRHHSRPNPYQNGYVDPAAFNRLTDRTNYSGLKHDRSHRSHSYQPEKSHHQSITNGHTSTNRSGKSKIHSSLQDPYPDLRYNGLKKPMYDSYPSMKKRKKKRIYVKYHRPGSDTSNRTSTAQSEPQYLPGEQKYLSPSLQYLPGNERSQYGHANPNLQYINPGPMHLNQFASPGRGPIAYLTVGPGYANDNEPKESDPVNYPILPVDDDDFSGRHSKYDHLGPFLKGRKKKKHRRRFSTPDDAAVAIQSMYRGYAARKELESAQYLRQTDFAKQFIDDLIDEFLQSEVIPDILIEVISERRYLPKEHPAFIPSILTCEDIVDETVEQMAEEIVIGVTDTIVDNYMTDKWNHKDHIDDYGTTLLDDIVVESVELVVADTIEDLVQEHLNKAAVYDSFMEIFEDVEKPYIEDAVREAIFEVILEDYISEFVEDELNVIHSELAQETLARYDAAVIKKQLKDVSQHAGEVLVDSFFLDYILTVIARNGKIWTEREYFDKFLDATILDVLFHQYYNVRDERKCTEENKSLKKHHEKVTSNIATDVLLTELCEQLDEDMEDLHEYEVELDKPEEEETPRYTPDPVHPPIDLRDWMGKSNILKV